VAERAGVARGRGSRAGGTAGWRFAGLGEQADGPATSQFEFDDHGVGCASLSRLDAVADEILDEEAHLGRSKSDRPRKSEPQGEPSVFGSARLTVR
jgi:hypothetical protein